jgi:hypothetical protein
MADIKFGQLRDADKATQRFVIEGLEAKIMRHDCPKTLNLDVEFSRFLQSHGVDELRASEIAAQQRLLVRRRVTDQIQRWNGQGVSSPWNFVVESDDVVVSWRHERYNELTGYDPLGSDFVDIYDWLGTQTNRAFLFPCVCFLKILGCDPIFITDGSRDEGIDCIGLLANGGLRSTAIFVQARSKGDVISGDIVLQEFAKYTALPRTDKYLKYLHALKMPKLQDGMGILYVLLTNSDFKFSAQQNAARLGVLLRSRRQLAQTISTAYTVERLEQLKGEIVIPSSCDLTTSFASKLTM